jgi:hypothetical protein
MKVISPMRSFAFERHGPFAEYVKLVQAIKESLRGLGYGR